MVNRVGIWDTAFRRKAYNCFELIVDAILKVEGGVQKYLIYQF
ncbi:hypothetical protein [Pelosinus propionicus]|uniref:Uncharacterized protein n=1 Tax=Pelosinus propionicus DSM 13327 TaxID=1123291 RepID=A0A1I4K756_9FIRM|nr:hypothetical protein [Pelosinus propionicus]SFL74584.1 hypothetical protein SAMN04490355_101616 [Pelosinus propionicus DSM 13327]